MPLLFVVRPAPDTGFGLWKIEEPESFFLERLHLTEAEHADLALFKGIRRLEWLAGRWLLHRLTGETQRLHLGKDAFSKPFFINYPERYCSLSHSHGYVGALVADRVCGCDVQVLVEKMPRLAHKFVNLAESEYISKAENRFYADYLHILWTAKESLYKAYGLKELDFRAQLRVEPFAWNGQYGQSTGWVEKNEVRQAYRLFFQKYEMESADALIWTVCLNC